MADLRTLEELSTLIPENPEDAVVFQRLVRVAEQYLPVAWKEWKTFQLTKDEVLGGESDPKLLNKIRFALPTVSIVQAFDPPAVHISEKGYRAIKIKMLNWPFCVGLIIRPNTLAARIRGSAVQNELVNAALGDIKPLLISQKEASKQLSEESQDSDLDENVENNKEISEKTEEDEDTPRLDKLEKSNEELKLMVQSLIDSLGSRKGNVLSGSQESDNESQEIFSDVEEGASAPPPLLDLDLEEEQLPDRENDFCFKPHIKEQEPLIPPAKPHIEALGIDCLRLGKPSFNRVRYAEVQKRLQAFPVFSALQVNTQIGHLASHDAASEQLLKTDTTLGVILHASLLERDYFSEAMKVLISRHPTIKKDVHELLVGPEAKFRQASDDLLQYVCGRRVECIEQRRKRFYPKNTQVVSMLDAIPPSASHLFDAESLAELTKQHSNSFRQYNRTSGISQPTLYQRQQYKSNRQIVKKHFKRISPANHGQQPYQRKNRDPRNSSFKRKGSSERNDNQPNKKQRK